MESLWRLGARIQAVSAFDMVLMGRSAHRGAADQALETLGLNGLRDAAVTEARGFSRRFSVVVGTQAEGENAWRQSDGSADVQAV